MARYPFGTECDEMELILIGMAIALTATAVNIYCAYTGTTELPEEDITDDTA
jgi:hypothetical protein